MSNYVVEIFKVDHCCVSEYDNRGKKLVTYYKLASNEFIVEIIDAIYYDYEFSCIVRKLPYRPSIYLESAIAECKLEIDRLVTNYKKSFPKRKKALIRIKKVNNKEVKKNE